MMFKIDYLNKNNDKDKGKDKDKKNNIDSDDLENLYDLLKKKNKDESEKKLCIAEYQNLWLNIEDIFFSKNEKSNKQENIEISKVKIDINKNKYYENENVSLEIKENTNLELLFKIIRYKEITNYINYYDNDYDYYSNEDEEPPVINIIINEIYNLEKILNLDKKAEKLNIKRKIQFYLFLIYMILKNYPFFIPKRCYLEKYFFKLKKYKDWPGQIGSQGKLLYHLFINELYLPGITIFQEIREKYFLDSIDPSKFLLISDDFLRYYFLFEDRNNSSTYKFLKDDVPNEELNISAKDIFSPASNIFNTKEFKQKVDAKSLKEFNYLTVMHLIIFFCQQVLSHEEKLRLGIYQRLCEQYFKTIPDYKTKEGYIDLLGKSKSDQKRENINSINDKNISRNTLNKSLLNSFLNILDSGLKTDYYKDFLPMIKEIEKKIMSSINGQEGQHNINLLNLREFLIPKIEIINQKDASLLYLYQCNYINIEDKYLSHLNKKIDYKDYDITNEDKQRVDQFNCIVDIKKNILEKYLKLRFILYEEQLISFINILINNVEDLQDKLLEREYNEKKLLIEQKQKEKEQKEKKLKQEIEKKIKRKKDDSQIEKERKKKEYEEKLKNMSYYELKKLFENNPINVDIQKIIQKRESNALPEVENFLSSIIIYILPNENFDQHLTDYINRNDFIYQFFLSKKNVNYYNNLNQLLKENLCIYLEEAKNYLELDVYKIVLTPIKEQEGILINYFYSFIEVEFENEDGIKISYLNNRENPEYEKSVNNSEDIKKVYIMNLMIKEKDKNESLPGAKYILNENSGLLTVFCMKNLPVETNNINYFGKILSNQANAEIFNCDEIKIEGTFKIQGLPNLGENNNHFKELIVGHATYDLDTYEKNVKLKIATFTEFNTFKNN